LFTFKIERKTYDSVKNLSIKIEYTPFGFDVLKEFVKRKTKEKSIWKDFAHSSMSLSVQCAHMECGECAKRAFPHMILLMDITIEQNKFDILAPKGDSLNI
jgi:hypothetical protein